MHSSEQPSRKLTTNITSFFKHISTHFYFTNALFGRSKLLQTNFKMVNDFLSTHTVIYQQQRGLRK